MLGGIGGREGEREGLTDYVWVIGEGGEETVLAMEEVGRETNGPGEGKREKNSNHCALLLWRIVMKILGRESKC